MSDLLQVSRQGTSASLARPPRLIRASLAATVVVLLFTMVPSGAFAAAGGLYVADGLPGTPGELWQFSLRSDGLPIPLAPSPTVLAGEDSKHIAITANGRFAYATGGADGLVYGYRVSSRRGRLVPLEGAPPNAGIGAHGVAVAPNGRTAYVASQEPGTVSQFEIDRRTGALRTLQPATVASGAGASGVAIAPDGRSAYVTNLEANSVSQYDIDPASGALRPMSPATIRVPGRPGGVGSSPDGRSLYVATLAGRLYQFTIDPRTARLLPKHPVSVPVELGAAGVAMTPNGRFLYVPNAGVDTVSQFSVDPRTGGLAPLSPPTIAVGDVPEGAAVTPDGRSLYATSAGAGTVSWLRIDARSGRLHNGATALATGPSPHGAVVTPDQGPRATLRPASRPPLTVQAGEPLRLDARGSSDVDGSVARYRWSFGDGKLLADGPALLSHRYNHPGRYTLRLAVTDNEGCSAKRLYTGQTASCNGGRRAIAVRRVTVRASR